MQERTERQTNPRRLGASSGSFVVPERYGGDAAQFPTVLLPGPGIYPRSLATHRDHYQTLQVPRLSDHRAIQAAYRRLARRLHPDVNRAPDATQRMQAVNEAYAVLSNPARQAAYLTARIAEALRIAHVGVHPGIAPPPAAGRSYQRRQTWWWVLGVWSWWRLLGAGLMLGRGTLKARKR